MPHRQSKGSLAIQWGFDIIWNYKDQTIKDQTTARAAFCVLAVISLTYVPVSSFFYGQRPRRRYIN